MSKIEFQTLPKEIKFIFHLEKHANSIGIFIILYVQEVVTHLI